MDESPQYLTMAQAAKAIPAGLSPSPSSLYRWCAKGVRARDGTRIRLQHARFGRRIATTREWLDEFARLNAEHSTVPANATRITPSPKQAEADLEAECQKAGI